MKKVSLLLALILTLPAAAFAHVAVNVNANANANIKADVTLRGESASSSGKSASSTASASSSEKTKAQATTTPKKTATMSTTTVSTKGSLTSESHRSAVAAFVASLLADADRDGGIGAEVRAVAQSQQDAASTTADAILKVESRSALKTLLIGSDWKNLGTLRSQLAKGSADVARLEAALDKATDASVKADLEAQIKLMTDEQAELQEFVEDHESAFSFFGWFTKLFS